MATIQQLREIFGGSTDFDTVDRAARELGISPTDIADELHLGSTGGKNAQRMSASVDNYQASLYGTGEALAGAAGLTGVQNFFGTRRRSNEVEAQVASERAQRQGAVDQFKDVHGVGDFADYAVGLGIQSLPYMGEAALGGLTGRMIAGPARAALGGSIGAATASYPSSVGDILGNQREQANGQTDLLSAAALGVPYAAANVIGVEGALARGQLFRNSVKALDNVQGVKGGLARAGSSALRTGAEEAGNETFQEFMNQAGRMAVDPNATFSNPESNDRFYESGIGGAVLGGLTGGLLGGWRRSHTYTNNQVSVLPDATPQTEYTPPDSLTNTAVTDLPGFASRPQDPLQQQIAPLDTGPSVNINPNAGQTLTAPAGLSTNSQRQSKAKPNAPAPVTGEERAAATEKYRVEPVLDDGTEEGHWRVFGQDFFKRSDLNKALDKAAIEDRSVNPGQSELEKQLNAAGPAFTRPAKLRELAAGLYGSTPEKTAYNLNAAIQGGAKDADRLAAVYEQITGNESPAWKALQEPKPAAAPAAPKTAEKPAPAPAPAAVKPTPQFEDDDIEGMARATLMKLFNGNEMNVEIALADLRGDKPADIQKQYDVSDSLVRKLRGIVNMPKRLEVAARQAGVPVEKLAAAFAKRDAEAEAKGETLVAEESGKQEIQTSDDRPLTQATDEELTAAQQESDTLGTQGMTISDTAGGTQIADASTRNNSRAKLNKVKGNLTSKTLTLADLNNLYEEEVNKETDEGDAAAEKIVAEVERRHRNKLFDEPDQREVESAVQESGPEGLSVREQPTGGAGVPGRNAAGNQPAASGQQAAATQGAAVQGQKAAAGSKPAAGKKEPKGKVGTAWDKLHRQLAAAKVDMPAWESLTPDQRTRATDQYALNGKIGIEEAQKVIGASGAAAPRPVPAPVAPKIDEKSAATVARVQKSTLPSTKEKTGADFMAKLNAAAEAKKNKPIADSMAEEPRKTLPVLERLLQKSMAAAASVDERMPKKGDTLHFNDDITSRSEVRRNQNFVVDRVEHEQRRGWVVYGRLFNKETGEEETEPGLTIKYPDGTTTQHGDGTERFSLANFKETNKLWQDLRKTGLDNMTGAGVPRNIEGKPEVFGREDHVPQSRSYAEIGFIDYDGQRHLYSDVIDGEGFFQAHWTTRATRAILKDEGVYHLLSGLDGVAIAEADRNMFGALASYVRYPDGERRLHISALVLESENGAFVILHELGHAADLTTAHGEDPQGRFSANTMFSVVVRDDEVTPVGAIARELYKLYKTNEGWSFFGYPFDRQRYSALTQNSVRRELFAQVFAAYMINPMKMEQDAPITYHAFQEILKSIRSTDYGAQLVQAKAAFQRAAGQQRPAGDASRAGPVSEHIQSTEGSPEVPPGRTQAGRGRSAQAGRQAERLIEALPQASRGPARKLWTTISDAAKKGFYGAAFTWDLADIAQSKLPTVKKYMDLMGKKAAVKTHIEDQVEKILAQSERVAKTDRMGRQQTGTGEHSINQFLYDSTISGKWGYKDDPNSNVRVDPEMERRFNAFTPDAQALIKSVFQHGADTLRMKQRIIKDEINNEFRALAKDAGQDPEKVAELERKRRAALQHYDSVLFLTAGKPYSPLRRFGNYVTVARSQEFREAVASNNTKAIERMQADENHYFVAFYETLGQAEEQANKLQGTGKYAESSFFEKEKGLDAIHNGRDMLSAFQRLRNLVKSELEVDPGDQVAKSINSMISDLYLQTLAETSARKAEIKRRNVAGADKDMLRAFATQGRADAHFIAALKHNGDVTDSMYEMRREAHEPGGDKAERMRLFNEFMSRHALHMDYRETRLQDAIIRGTSLWMLATSPAYYLQNATQTPMISVPYMAGKHGYGRSWSTITQAYKDLGPMSEGLKFSDRMDFSKAPADVQRMLQDLVAAGRIDIALDQDLGRFQSRADNQLSHAWNSVDRRLRGMAQRVEAINRVTTAIAAYRMELARNGGNHAAATDYASKVIRVTHGDYSAFNAPRYLTPGGGLPAAKVITQFRKFQIIQASLILRLFNNSFSSEVSDDERAMARKALLFTLGHTAAMGGFYGLPGAATLAWLLARAFGDPDEPDDDEVKLRRLIGNEDLADLILKGAPAYLGVDLSGKLGMGTAFSMVPYAKLDSLNQDTYKSALLGLSGPFIGGLLPKFASGVDQMGRGNWYKGMELMLPSGFSNVAKAYRFGTEGVSLKSNDVVLPAEDVTFATEMFQAMGLQTKQLSDRAFDQRVLTEFEQFYNDKTTRLRDKYAKATKQGDTETASQIREQWMDLQESRVRNGFPRQPLSQLLRAPVQQSKRERQAVNGVGVSRSTRGLAQELSTI